MADPTEPLSAAQAHRLIWRVADGTATPEEARRLIVEFVAQADAGAVAPDLFAYVVDCLRAFAHGERELRSNRDAGRERPEAITVATLDGAFGLARPQRHRPARRDDEKAAIGADIAAEVLRELLVTGSPVQEACGNVADARRERGAKPWGRSQIESYWAEHKIMAVALLRHWNAEDWTKTELDMLAAIYADVPGVVLPGETPFEGRHTLDRSTDEPSPRRRRKRAAQ